MNPLTQISLVLHSNLKVRRLEADVERMADVLAIIITLAEGAPAPMTDSEVREEIARLGRAALDC